MKNDKTRKIINIGLIGAAINSENMGCVTLTYSLIGLLEIIAAHQKLEFNYFILDADSDENKICTACRMLNISRHQLVSITIRPLHRCLSMFRRLLKGCIVLMKLFKCDFFIDLTGGDSFADIYGQRRFDKGTNIKLLIEKLKRPLILGPQTYGPYSKEKNLRKAKKAIEQAQCVIARDQLSADYIAAFSAKKVYVATDLAFRLPYEGKDKNGDREKIKIGINVSGLLVKNKTEHTDVNVQMKTDYSVLIEKLITYLISESKYEIHIIPHVGDDGGGELRNNFPDLLFWNKFDEPISAKNVIAQMDIFIGARMHATIAAFSAGVATIPIGYSRKFRGLYENLNYKYVVDLESLKTEEAVLTTIDYIKHYEILKLAGIESMKIVNEKSELTYSIFSDYIKRFVANEQ